MRALALALALAACAGAGIAEPGQAQTVSRAGAPFEPVLLTIQGPQMDERAGVNPFADVRLDWVITQGAHSWTVPGYFAGCGDAADSGCSAGAVWRAHFVPPGTGEYRWSLRFTTGKDVAVGQARGSSLPGDAASGGFAVTGRAVDPVRARGLLAYTGERYYRYAGDNSLFFKFGPDAPENMLAFAGFDDTPDAKGLRKSWAPHIADLKPEGKAYLWGRDRRGAGLLGMIDYLADAGANSLSMLLWNAGGDDRNVFPHLLAIPADEYAALKPDEQWTRGLVQDRFDLSKLDQWQRAFSYADRRGLHLHFKLQETENDAFMDAGALGRTRRLYLREMVARFGHFLALTWNLGEENVQRAGDVRQMASHLAALDPYDHPLVLHSYPDQKERWRPHLGPGSVLNGLSLQGRENDNSDLRGDVIAWSNWAMLAGKPLVIAYDEPGRADGGAGVDPDYPAAQLPSKPDLMIDPAQFMRTGLWNALTAGASGAEAYYGYKTGCSDLDCQDHRTRAQLWREGRHALAFFRDHVGDRATRMFAVDHVTKDRDDYVFAEPGEFYVIVPAKEEVVLLTGGLEGRFAVQWFDRANGGALQPGGMVQADGKRRELVIGYPPETGSGHWAAIVSRMEDEAIRVEAEDFAEQRLDNVRSWCRAAECPPGWEREGTANYVALVPDTRRTHDDVLVPGENFSGPPGKMAILSYDVDFPAAGRWYLWVRAFASGSEDNGLHAGLGGQWPDSAARIQYCPGRGQWFWDSRQRTAEDHCGVVGGLWLDVAAPGRQRVTFSMREDGFVFDAFYLTRNPQMPAALLQENLRAAPAGSAATGH